MKKYVFTDSSGRICAIQDCALFPDDRFTEREFDFPEGFVFGTERDYLLVNGALVFSPVVYESGDNSSEEIND